jgi:hypothetical protein
MENQDSRGLVGSRLISQATVPTAEPRRAPTPGSPPPYVPKVPHTPLPACTRTPTRLPSPTLRNVILADLRDVARLLALHQHALARAWLQGGEAAQRNVVAAAVHARRVGLVPCRLFVVLQRDRRWEVITQEGRPTWDAFPDAWGTPWMAEAIREGLVATIGQAPWEAAWYDGGLTMRPQSATPPA